MCCLSVNEYDLISSCESSKEMWDLSRTTYKGTDETRISKINLFTTQFESFIVKEGLSIHELRTRFSTIANELKHFKNFSMCAMKSLRYWNSSHIMDK